MNSSPAPVLRQPNVLSTLRKWSKSAWLLHGWLIASLVLMPAMPVMSEYRMQRVWDSELNGVGGWVYSIYDDQNNNLSWDEGESTESVLPSDDPDNDQLSNEEEYDVGTSPYNPDSDYDGIVDGVEVEVLGGALSGYNPNLWDSDSDGYSDHDEFYNCYEINYLTLGSGSSYYDWDGDSYKNHEDSDPANGSLWSDWDHNGYNQGEDPPTDSDGDGYYDSNDSHPSDSLLWSDWNNNGTNDDQEPPDGDGDGVPDANDTHPTDPTLWSDGDGDGVNAENDSHPANNLLWCDWNSNGVNDDQNTDGDAVPDDTDSHPSNSALWSDWDGDNINEESDSHPADMALWSDWNGDGDNNETDGDEDGVVDGVDSHPHNLSLWYDWNNDGVNEDPPADLDGDTYLNADDSHPEDLNLWSDWNGDGDNNATDGDEDEFSNENDSDPRNGALWSDWNHDGDNHATDGDEDGAADGDDSHPRNPSLWCDWNGNGFNDTDADNDGHTDDNGGDSHPNDSSLWNDWNYNGTNDTPEEYADNDQDGYANWCDTHPSDPAYYTDWDVDTLNEDVEIAFGSNPNLADTDADGLNDDGEYLAGTNPSVVDSDADGLSDFEELVVFTNFSINGVPLDPLNAHTYSVVYEDYYLVDLTDADDDSIPDRIEEFYAPAMDSDNPADAEGDLDADYISNAQEFINGTRLDGDLNVYDMDGDGLSDVEEALWPSILDPMDPADATEDPDGDGITNFEELRTGLNPTLMDTADNLAGPFGHWSGGAFVIDKPAEAVSGRSPDMATGRTELGQVVWEMPLREGDTDGDLIADQWEHKYRRGPGGTGVYLRRAADAFVNLDGDTLNSLWEYRLGTNPFLTDTDGDGVADGLEDNDGDGVSNQAEIAAMTDPLTAPGTPPTMGWNGNGGGVNPGLEDDVSGPGEVTEWGSVRDFSFMDWSAPTGVGMCFQKRYYFLERISHPTTGHPYPPMEEEHPSGYCYFVSNGAKDGEGNTLPYEHHETFPGISANHLGTWENGITISWANRAPASRYAAGGSGGSVYEVTGGGGIGAKYKAYGDLTPNFWYGTEVRMKTVGGNADRTIIARFHRSDQYEEQGDAAPVIRFKIEEGTTLSSLQYNFVPPAGPGPDEVIHFVDAKFRTRSVSAGDLTGPKYRKIGLNGMPLSDAKPQQSEETNVVPEETFVDAYNRQLRHGVTDVWSQCASTDLPLMIRRDVTPEAWSWRSGLRPEERPERPFGAGWTSNVTPHIRIEYSSDLEAPMKAAIVDDQGASRSFIKVANDGEWIPSEQQKQDSKTCFDRLVEIKSGGIVTGYELHKRFGGICYFEPTPILQTLAQDRLMGSDLEHNNQYTYARMTSVTTPQGNEMVYVYPQAEFLETLIPRKIYDPRRPSQVMTLVQEDGRITSVTGPSGETVYYEYKMVTTGNVTATVLDKVIRIDDEDVVSQIEYDYSYEAEADPTPDPTVAGDTYYGHLELSSIKEKSLDPQRPDSTYTFTYSLDHSMFYEYDYGGDQAQMRTRAGGARLLSSVTRPDGSVIGFGGDREVTVLANRTVVTDGVVTQVTGPLGDYTYTFSEPHISSPYAAGVVPPAQGVLQISFKELVVTSDAGEEVFTFNPEAGMALASVTDLSGNTTTYAYEDVVPVEKNPSDAYGVLYYDDPTEETNAMHGQAAAGGGTVNGKKFFEYDELRQMTAMTDEAGVRTSYVMDEDYRVRTKETVTDTQGTEATGDDVVLKVTDFEYDADTANNRVPFRGFMTKQIVRTTGMTVPQGQEAPIGELVTAFEPDGNGRVLNQIVDPEGLELITSYTYTGGGSKATVTDPNGNVTRFEYEPQTLRLKKVIYPDATPQNVADNPSKEMFYDAHGNVIKEVNELGVATFNEYDLLNRLLKTTVDLDGNNEANERTNIPNMPTGTSLPSYDGDLVTEVLEYNGFNQAVKEKDARGIETWHTYDSIGRRTATIVNATAATEGAKLTTKYVDNNPLTEDFVGGSVFDTAGFKPLRVIDARGFMTVFEYDDLYREVKRTLTDTTAATESRARTIVTRKEYDDVGNVTKVIQVWDAADPDGPNNSVTTTVYDAQRRPVRVELPEGGSYEVPAAETLTTYTPAGQVWTETDVMGGVTNHYYDGAGREVKVLGPEVEDEVTQTMVRPQVRKAYDGNGSVIQVEDARGNITDTVYDERNRAVLVTAPIVQDAGSGSQQRPVTETVYDAGGRAVKVIDPLGNETETVYDRAGRACVVIAPETAGQTHITRTVYDAGGNAKKVKNAKGQTVTNTYDALGRLIHTVDEAGIENEFGYDKGGNRTRVEDGLERESTFAYDAQNRLLAQTFANGDAWSYEFDAANKIAQTDAKEVTTTYGYDVRNRLRESAALGLERTLSYDDAGRLTKVEEEDRPEAKVEYTYDVLGRQTSEKARGVAHVYGYDLGGNRVTAAYGTSRTVVTSYDGVNRPETITEGGRVTRYGYDLAGRAVHQVAGNGQASVNVYDELGRLKERTLYLSTGALTPGGVMSKFTWDHDAVGNVTAQAEQWPGTDLRAAGARVTAMTYDGANRLLTETVSDPGCGVTATNYAYDAGNNRLTKTVTGGSEAGYWEYSYNEANQLNYWQKRTAVGGTLVKHTALSYDGNGNREGQAVWEGANVAETKAQVSNQGITYESVAAGPAGDGLRVNLQAGQPGEGLDVSVSGDDVNVRLAKSEGAKAEGSHQGITYQAKTAGTAGNGLTVSLTQNGYDTVRFTVAGQAVVVKLPLTRGSTAGTTWQGMSFTAKEAGAPGNQISVLLEYNEIDPEELTVEQQNSVVVVYLAHDGEFNITSTTAEVVAAINTAGYLVNATGGSGTVAAAGSRQLTGGGVGEALYKTRTEVVAAMQAHAGASALIEASGSGTDIMLPAGALELSGGAAPALTSTGAQVVAALSGNGLVTATGGSGSVLAATTPLELVRTEPAELTGEGALTVYEWDAQDRLVGVTMHDGKAYSYTYDYRTRRIGIGEGGTISNPQQTAVLFGGGLSLAEYVSANPQSEIANPQSSTVHYLRGPDMGGGVGGLLYSSRSGVNKYNLSNGRGDIVAQSDGSAALTWTASYEAYGKRTKETGSNADKQRANSKDEDPTGLLNEGFRYRDIETGMFISRDPAGFVDGPNVYAYVKQNPWTGWDPAGLYTESGHFYTTYMVAIACGMGQSEAFQTAYYSQLPDEHNDYTAYVDPKITGSKIIHRDGFLKRVQTTLHSLHGKSEEYQISTGRHWSRDICDHRTGISRVVSDKNSAVWERGLAIHALADSYAHTMTWRDGNWMHIAAYSAPFGHALDGKSPDNVSNRPRLYAEYVNHLSRSLSMVTGQKANKQLIEKIMQMVAGIPPGGEDAAREIAEFRRLAQSDFGYDKSDNSYKPEDDPEQRLPNMDNLDREKVGSLMDKIDRSTEEPKKEN